MSKKLRIKKFFKKIWHFVSHHNAPIIALELAVFVGIIFAFAVTNELILLNVHSHPQAGDYWTVSFETKGTADLTITPDDQQSIDDLDFVSLSCDDQERTPQILEDDVIFFPNWSCEGEGEITHLVNVAGVHTLKFQFGDKTGYAYNSPGWLSDYGYRKQITIGGSTADAQTNYQMKLTVHKGTGTDSGDDVYLNNHCQDDFDDIRFTTSDGTTELDHWRESYTSGTSAVFWIEFDSIPVSPGSANFYIYYDNSSASSASNGATTWVFFDDFDNLNNWTGATAYFSVADSIVTGSSSNTWRTIMTTASTFQYNNTYRARIYWSSTATHATIDRGIRSTDAGYHATYNNQTWYWSGASTRSVPEANSRGTWMILSYDLTSTLSSFFVNDIECVTSPGPAALSGTKPLAIQVYANAVKLDWYLVGKLADPAPSWGTWGSEEQSCTADSGACSENGDCCSEYCGSDYDAGKFCAQDSTSCVHDGSQYANGAYAPDCKTAGGEAQTGERWKCGSGTWSGESCTAMSNTNNCQYSYYTCSAGTPASCGQNTKTCGSGLATKGVTSCSAVTSSNYCDYACDGSCRIGYYGCVGSGSSCEGGFSAYDNCGEGTGCSGSTCDAVNLCDETWRYCQGAGDNYYDTGGDYYCQGSCDGSNLCEYAINCDTVPSAPTSLLCEGQTNPMAVTDETPEFSAVYNDPDAGDTANYYQVQVDDDSGFGSTIWDSTKTSMTNCTKGNRCQDISHGGPTPLARAVKWYWKIKFWDIGGAEGVWSTEEAYFQMFSPRPAGVSPSGGGFLMF